MILRYINSIFTFTFTFTLVRAYTCWFSLFYICAYTTLIKLFAVFYIYITLPRDRKLIAFLFIIEISKCWNPPQKRVGPKACINNLGRLWKTSKFDRDYLLNRWRYPKSERHFIDKDSSAFGEKKSGELWSTNNTVLQVATEVAELDNDGPCKGKHCRTGHCRTGLAGVDI